MSEDERDDNTTDGNEKIREHVRNAQDARLPGRLASQIALKRLVWHWRDHFPRGKTIEVCGDPGVYKTGIVIDLCARITVGAPFPTEPKDWRHEPAKILFFSAEDDGGDTLVPRFVAAGGDVKLGCFVTPDDDQQPNLPEDEPKLREWVRLLEPALVVFDPIDAFFGKKIDANSNPDVRRALRPLIKLGSRTKTTFLLIRHLNKDVKLGRAMYRTSGSIGVTGQTRASFIVGPAPDDPNTFIFACNKLNNAPKPRSISYRVVEWVVKDQDEKPIKTQRVEWGGETDTTADDVVQDPKSPPGPKPEKIGMAELIIKTHLKDGQWHPSKPIIDFGKERGVSYKIMTATAKALGVEKQKVGFNDPAQWDWRLTESASAGTPQNSSSSMNPHAEKGFAEDEVPHADPENSSSSTNPYGENDFTEDEELPGDQNSSSSINSFSPNGSNHSGETKTPEDEELRDSLGNEREKSGPDPSGNGIPFVVTQAMRATLHELGFRDEEISLMTPAEAHDIIRRGEGIFRFDEEVDGNER
jgi:hypothetical protein